MDQTMLRYVCLGLALVFGLVIFMRRRKAE
jgi:hypothetical protein